MVVFVGTSARVSVGFADGGGADAGRSVFRLVADGATGRCVRDGDWPGSAVGGRGGIDVAGTSDVVDGGGVVVPIVDRPGSAGCTGSGGPTR